LEVESESVEDMGGGSGSEMEGRKSRRGKRMSYIPKLKVLWKSFGSRPDGLI